MAAQLLAGVAVAGRPVADLVAAAVTYSELADLAVGV
jgi:antitoxin (DNA-binding transcriptional repressor) of toxin-antitoxin stability system